MLSVLAAMQSLAENCLSRARSLLGTREPLVWLLAGVMIFWTAPCATAKDKEKIDMPLMIEQKNLLTDFGDNPDAPPPPDVGIAIAFSPSLAETGARFPASGPVVLHGAYEANGTILKRCEGNSGAGIFVTVIRVDRPFGRTDRLVTPLTESTKPPAPRPYPESYREGGQFRVDIKTFFELPSEPGQYSVEAVLGGYFSERLGFELVE
jgi:hypothetical protein